MGAGIVARFVNLRATYAGMSTRTGAQLQAARKHDGAVVLQAPTGAGKTLIAVEAMRRFTPQDRVLWFWFAPFDGLIQQSRAVIAAHAPELRLLDLASDRSIDAVLQGGVFVTTWASVAARSAESRRARTTGDAGLALDAVIALARAEGMRIGCVVDEAHHGFHTAAQARAFFTDVLAPDYTLMMTATPNDRDALAFERDTGYRIGEPADWASVSRFDAVEERLLKQGVRMVRFIARDGDATQLIDFEHLALSQCAAMHRRIQQELTALGIALTPLMLVQVPDGTEAMKDARDFLVGQLGFTESAVRVHTAKEPDPDLISLAQDPSVEVLIFKMAVALGFDAPRAFTLAALRGVRDVEFSVQVIGRIVRRHALLQTRDNLPPLLQHGYVFLANSQSQEGFLDAAQQINALTTRAPEINPQYMLTVVGDTQQVQIVRVGASLSLLVDAQAEPAVISIDTGLTAVLTSALDNLASNETRRWTEAAQDLLNLAGGAAVTPNQQGASAGTSSLQITLASPHVHRYPRRADAPAALRSERLPRAPEDYEARLVDFVDFNHKVLADRLRSNEQVTRNETDLFHGRGVNEGTEDIWASLAPAAVAEKAEQIRLRLKESNDRELQARLLKRFADAIRQSGAPVPRDEEELMRELDLVLVRNPSLLRDAFTRYRHGLVMDIDAPLVGELQSDMRLEPATRAMYGVYPPGMNDGERAVAALLDRSPLVRWWHRNPADARRPDSLGLYRWDDGDGFYPDFVVSVSERQTPGGIALVEVKGDFLWGESHEVDKAGARHSDYGSVFMVGRQRGERDFLHLRKLGDKLASDGGFSIDRLRHV